MIVYVLTMNRYGSDENHSYVSGVFTSLRQALESGVSHAEYRAYKYEPDIVMTNVDNIQYCRPICRSLDEARHLLAEFTKENEVERAEALSDAPAKDEA